MVAMYKDGKGPSRGRTTLNLPKSLEPRIKDRSKIGLRSVSGEILYLIEKGLELPERNLEIKDFRDRKFRTSVDIPEETMKAVVERANACKRQVGPQITVLVATALQHAADADAQAGEVVKRASALGG